MSVVRLIGIAHAIDDANHQWISRVVIVLSVAAWIAAVVIFFVAQRKSKTALKANPFAFTAALAVFAGLIASEIAMSEFCEWAAFAEIKDRLFAHVTSVETRSGHLADIATFSTDLRTIHGEVGHHSNPLRFHYLSIVTDKGTFHLWVARDSGIPREYWVHNPTFYFGDLGRLYTSSLDSLD